MKSEDTEFSPGPHNTSLDLRMVINELGSVINKWFQIGIQLGVDETKLRQIEADHRTADRCLSEVIMFWLNGNTNIDITWNSLIKALEASIVNEKGLAKSLIQKHAPVSKRYAFDHISMIEPEAKRRRLETDAIYPLKAQDLEIAKGISEERQDNTNSTTLCLTFPCLDLKNLTKVEKEQLHQRLHSDSVDMMRKFQELFSATTKSLKERKIPITELLCHLVGMGPMKPTFSDLNLPPFRCQLPGLKEAKNTDDVMLVVGDYCSFFNLQMLECIIDKLGTDQDKKNLSHYKEEFNKYAERHVFECPSDVGKVSEDGHVSMFVILDEIYENCTVSQLQLFVVKLQDILCISPGDGLKLCHITPGSIKLTFQLPSSVVNQIFPLSSKQETALANEGVYKLWLIYQFTAKKNEEKVETIADTSIAHMKEPDDDVSITDSALGTCSVVTGTTYVGAFQRHREKEYSDRKLDDPYTNIERGFDMRAKLLSPDESSKYPLHRAAYRGELDGVKKLTEETQLSPLQRDSYGNTAVHYAAAGGSLLTLKYFIEVRQCSAACLGVNEQTPLHFAAEHRHLELVKYLVTNQQMDPMIQDKHGVTVLHSACIGGDIRIIQYLTNEFTKYIPLDVVINEKIKAGNAPVHFAALCGHLHIVKLFITKFLCDPNIPGWWDRTPLHASAQEGHLGIVRYLVDEEKCDVSCRDKDEVTPLHLAAARGQLDTIKFLIERNGDPLVVNKFNDTPLHWAAEFGQLDVVKFFVEILKCPVGIRGHLNMTPLEQAGRNGHINVTQYLCQLCQEL